ncbi:NAD(P)-binding domain-containing protein [Paenibacillus phoenicis]|uniref:NAD(P)-binding domain-containing protein n=2 Tax=Paenibacillus TaxID=44249 RepID=UPI003D281529
MVIGGYRRREIRMKEKEQSEMKVSKDWNTTKANQPPVSVIGLGMMGSALAQTFLKEGHPTTIWNRTRRYIGRSSDRKSHQHRTH